MMIRLMVMELGRFIGLAPRRYGLWQRDNIIALPRSGRVRRRSQILLPIRIGKGGPAKKPMAEEACASPATVLAMAPRYA
jgi:hypothetical protein